LKLPGSPGQKREEQSATVNLSERSRRNKGDDGLNKMRSWIEVENRKEADLLRRGLVDKEVRAFVTTMGALSTLQSKQAKERVLRFVVDHFRECSEMKLPGSPGQQRECRANRFGMR
jgi:hypothetical protein